MAADRMDPLRELFAKHGSEEYIGEDVSQVEHALQAAEWARDAGDTPAMIMAALCHDVGHLLLLAGHDLEPMEVRAGEPFTLTLYWRAERRPEADYTVFVHLLDEAGNLVAQMDGPPQGGAYPTPWWEAGDEVEDVRRVALPADAGEGTHRLVVGLYQWGTMERLPVFTGDGMPVPDGAIRLTEVHVVR